MWVLQRGWVFFKKLTFRWGGWLRIRLISLVKLLPSRLGGGLLWGWVYGMSWRSWFPRREAPVSVAPQNLLDRVYNASPRRGGPSRVPPRVLNLSLLDREWYSLDTVFPVRGDEPFQELGWDYFIQQQESDPTGEEEFVHDEDITYETSPPPSGDEDDPHLWEVDRFRWLERRELTYRRDDLSGGESVEFFESKGYSTRTTLDRLVDPGDGPVDNNPDENPLVYDGYYARWFTSADWYFFRVNPTRMTTGFTWPEGYYYYLLYEHRHTWGGDPTGGDTTRWARSTRGVTPWLFRRKTRRWDAARWGLFQTWKKRISRLWSRPPSRPRSPAGHTRRGGPSLRRHWWRQYRRLVNPKNNRWGAPFSGRTANFLTDTDEWGYFENTRFLANSQPHRNRQLQDFRGRLGMGRTRRAWTRFFSPSWWTQPGLSSRFARLGPPRKRVLPWVAPRWIPSVGVRPREVPPTGGVSLLLLLLGWLLFYSVLESIPLAINFVLNPVPGLELPGWTPTTRMWWWPADFFSWGKLTTTGSFEGDYLRKVTLGIPPEWELYRGGSPRERFSVRTWGFGAYRPHRENWRWQYLDPVGLHWWSHPGQGANLLQLTYRRSAWEPTLLGQSVTVGTDWLTQWFFGFNGRDINNNMGMRLFFPYMDWFIPSWAHAHDVIGDEWVVYRSFRTWKDEGQELETVRRMIDHRYNDLFDISKYLWKLMYKRMFPFPAWPTFMAEWSSRIDPIQRPFFTNPEWIPPVTPHLGEASLWEIAYLDSWERVSSSHLWPSSRANKRWRILLTTFDAEFSLDSRARSRSEGFPYMGVPTNWEPYLNRELLHRWGESNAMENFPQSYFAWWNSRVSLLAEVISPLWSKLVQQLVYPILVWSFYVGGFILLCRGQALPVSVVRGVATTPVQRFTPRWGRYRGVNPANGISSIPPKLGGVVLSRGNRYFRRWGQPNLLRGNPDRALLEEPHWKWTPEAYWSSHRGGFSRRTPRVGVRVRLTPRGGLPRGWISSPALQLGQVTRSNPSIPGGGFGYLAARFTPWRTTSLISRVKLNNKLWTPQVSPTPGESNWLLTPGGANRLASWGESYLNRSYPSPRRRPRRWFERFLHPEGVKVRYRRRTRRPRGWHARSTPRRENEGAGAGALLPNSSPQVGLPHWRTPPEWFHRKGQSAWLRHRYRTTLGGGGFYFLPHTSLLVRSAGIHLTRVNYPGRTTPWGESTPAPGYNVEWYRDEYFADLDGHQPDDDLENEFDSGLESYNGFRYLGGGLTPPKLFIPDYPQRGVLCKLVSYHRGCILPGGFYSQISPGGWNSTWGGPVWGPLGVDHPAGGLPLLGGYEVPRLGRRVTRVVSPERTTTLDEGGLRRRRRRRQRTGYFMGGDSLWSFSGSHLRDELNLLGWTTQEGFFGEFALDDLDGISFGSPTLHGGGYRWGGRGALQEVQNRPFGVGALSVWSPPRGLNGWRYLVGESLGYPTQTDPERLLLDRLTTGYNDGYDLETLEYDEDLFFDRDPEDPDDEDEDETEEVPRSRAQDFPPWVVDLALGGASPGEITPEGMYARLSDFNLAVPEDNEDAGFRASRRELRRYYRRGRVKMSPWRRRQNPLAFSRHVNPVNEYLRGVSPGSPDDGELTRRDAQGVTGVAYSDFENDEDYTGEVDPTLRLWALTEVYYGDYPTGVYLDS